MKNKKKNIKTPETSSDTPEWLLDLDKVGFVRKIFFARKWYGGDRWFVAISSVLLVVIILIGMFPQWFAPYDPSAEVGPSLLAPGDSPSSYILVAPIESGEITVQDIGDKSNNIGFIVGSPASQALREVVDALNDEAPEGVRYQPRQKRYDTLEEGLTALAAGETDGFVVSPDVLGETLDDYPTLQVASALRGETSKGYIF